jgi:ABC-type Mn2+/Zn2+ transport system permease subunit
MLLVTVTIVIGTRVAGSLLITALLILPGSTALVLSDRLRSSLTAAVGTGLVSAVAGLALRARWGVIPIGPAIVLTLFVVFLLAYGWSRVSRSRSSFS